MAHQGADLPEYADDNLSSASEAVRLLERHEPDSVVRALANTIISRAFDEGLDGLTDAEAQLAALEIYQCDTVTDGFASLFYNHADFIPAMLAATKRTGASVAHELLVRGLTAIGLPETAAIEDINAASKELLAAVDLAEETPEGGEELLKAFSEFDGELEERVEHLSDEMLALLKSATAEFKNFP